VLPDTKPNFKSIYWFKQSLNIIELKFRFKAAPG